MRSWRFSFGESCFQSMLQASTQPLQTGYFARNLAMLTRQWNAGKQRRIADLDSGKARESRPKGRWRERVSSAASEGRPSSQLRTVSHDSVCDGTPTRSVGALKLISREEFQPQLCQPLAQYRQCFYWAVLTDIHPCFPSLPHKKPAHWICA
jgi:hypothetical protein